MIPQSADQETAPDWAFHPLAAVFPLMNDEAIDCLAEDIDAHGLQVPIVVDSEGRIIDGRNRYRALQRLGRVPRSWEYHTTLLEGEALLSKIVALNLHRRHLNESQRACVAARLSLWEQGGDRRSLAFNDLPGVNDLPAFKVGIPTLKQQEAANLLNVSRDSVIQARKVVRRGVPSLVDAVEEGHVSVASAVEVSTLPHEEQEDLVARGKQEILEAARRIRADAAHRTHYSGENEWYTPAKYLEMARAVLGTIDLDPASSAQAQETVQATQYFSLENDGLTQPWPGRVWLNPPYSQPLMTQFIDKLLEELHSGRCLQAILLTNNSTETAWWQLAARKANAVCFPCGRIGFMSASRVVSAPMQGQTFFHFGADPLYFVEAFGAIGFVSGVKPKPAKHPSPKPVPTEAATPPLSCPAYDTTRLTLGTLCKHGHDFFQGQSLRRKTGHCDECCRTYQRTYIAHEPARETDHA